MSERNLFNISVLYHCIRYWIQFQYTYIHILKSILKSSKAFSVSLSFISFMHIIIFYLQRDLNNLHENQKPVFAISMRSKFQILIEPCVSSLYYTLLYPDKSKILVPIVKGWLKEVNQRLRKSNEFKSTTVQLSSQKLHKCWINDCISIDKVLKHKLHKSYWLYNPSINNCTCIELVIGQMPN